MAVTPELSILDQAVNGIVFPDRVVIFDIIDRLGVQDKKSSADPALTGAGFFIKLRHVLAVEHNAAKA